MLSIENSKSISSKNFLNLVKKILRRSFTITNWLKNDLKMFQFYLLILTKRVLQTVLCWNSNLLYLKAFICLLHDLAEFPNQPIKFWLDCSINQSVQDDYLLVVTNTKSRNKKQDLHLSKASWEERRGGTWLQCFFCHIGVSKKIPFKSLLLSICCCLIQR